MPILPTFPTLTVREATLEDWPKIWPLFQAVVRDGDTYPYPPETTMAEGEAIWFASDKTVYIAVDLQTGDVLGTYYIRPNQGRPGPASHMANAGFMVSPHARGRGLGREMGIHALQQAKTLGYNAIQYNLVVETNVASIRLWESLGFSTWGIIPRAFYHPLAGWTNARIMGRHLDDI